MAQEAIESKKPIYVTLLDVSQAFDGVDHEILLEEVLYKSGKVEIYGLPSSS